MQRIILFGLLLLNVSSYSQDLYVPRDVKRAYEKGTRSFNGKPGKNYWQNTARYNINIKATPPSKTVVGHEQITYINNSPDTLKEIVLKLFMNIHKPSVTRVFDPFPEYLTSGVTIDTITINGTAVKFPKNAGTVMPLTLQKPLPAKDSVSMSVSWRYNLAVHQPGSREGAIDSSTFFIAYFYPRVAVYDDYRGWDKSPFIDFLEFYNDFSDYTLQVEVPRNYAVWATGTLNNASEVLQPEVAARFNQSLNSDEVIKIATAAQMKQGAVTASNDFNTWKFTSSNIPDVAVAISNHYAWDGGSVVVDKSSNRRASVQAAYHDTAQDYHHMVRFSKDILRWLSFNLPGVPYPYEKTTIVQGYADMEYPMMVNDASFEDTSFSKFVAMHELAHTYMPFYMGINESRYPFMDEGWATALELLYNTEEMGEAAASGMFKMFRVNNWTKDFSQEQDMPIITPAGNLNVVGGGNNMYGKPALGYLALYDLLGKESFKKGLHEFMNTWKGKHPTPWDMFTTFNSGARQNLNWFWNSWFFSNGYIDIKIKSASASSGTTTLVIENVGGMPAPFDVVVTYSDGSKEKIHQTPTVWKNHLKSATIKINTRKPVQSISIDGGVFMDVTPANNKWMK